MFSLRPFAATQARQARSHQDTATFVHARRTIFAGKERPLDVNTIGSIEGILVIVLKLGDVAVIAGIAEQDIDRPPFGCRRVYIAAHDPWIGNVSGKDLDPIGIKRCPGTRQARSVQIDEHDPGAFGEEPARGSQSNTSASASDDADLILKQRHKSPT